MFPRCQDGAVGGLAEPCFEFGEGLLKGVPVWAVGWQEQQLASSLTNGVAPYRTFMAAEIIHDNDVAGRQGRHQHLLDVGRKVSAVDRPVEDAGGVDAV